MPWHARGDWDTATLEQYRRLIALRNEHVPLRRGSLRWLSAGEDHRTYVREHPTGPVGCSSTPCAPHHDGTGPRDGEIRLPRTLLGGGQPSTLQGEPLHAETTAKGPAWRLPGSIGAHVWAFDAHGLAWDSPQADGSSE